LEKGITKFRKLKGFRRIRFLKNRKSNIGRLVFPSTSF